MKKKYNILILSVFSLLCCGFTVRISGKYIPINAVTTNECGHYVNLDLKNKYLKIQIDTAEFTFNQDYKIDTVKYFGTYALTIKDRITDISTYLTINKLLSISNDSIYVSAQCQKYNKIGNIGKLKKIDKIAINKSELLGLFVAVRANKK